MNGPTIETNFGAWGTWGAANDTTVSSLRALIAEARAGGPITTITSLPSQIAQGSANLVGANLRIAYVYAIARRYMEGNNVGAGWGPDASTQARGWSVWYEGEATRLLAGRSTAFRLTGYGIGTPAEIQAVFVKAAKWLEGWKGDPRGGLRGLGAILRSLGSQSVTVARKAEADRGTTIMPSVPGVPGLPDDGALEKLLKALQTAGIASAVVGGIVVLGIGYLALRK
jgi:hypothetical protein